jgi:serine/threonine protein kinase
LTEGVPGFRMGSRIAGYRLEERVGAGGMAVVFRARDERLGRLVALKILTPALAGNEAFRQRFVRESRAAAAVDDPHIIPVLGAGEADGVLFIAMRYVSGGDARTLMRREGRLSLARAMAIISPVASALDAAHGAGLVHRDVKPANMLVDARPGRPDHVYLSDFGLSKGALSTSGLTAAGQFMGTADYIAPEQIEGRPVDGRADQYALACTAFELLTGAPPFRRDEVMAVMYAQLSEPPPLLTARRPGLPPAADQVFARALAKDPEDRYASCREFADALRAASGLAPYDSDPGGVPVAGGGLAARIAASPARARARPNARDDAVPARRRRRPGAVALLSGITVLAMAGITTAAILLIPPSHRAAGPSTRARTHPVTAAQAAQHRVTATPATRRPVTPATTAPAVPAGPDRTFAVAVAPPARTGPATPAPTRARSATPTPTPTHSVTPTPAPTDPVTPTPAPTPTGQYAGTPYAGS